MSIVVGVIAALTFIALFTLVSTTAAFVFWVGFMLGCGAWFAIGAWRIRRRYRP